MDDKLYEILEKLPRKNLIHLMWQALDIKHVYNTRQAAILEAMGAEVTDNPKTGAVHHRLPSTLKEIKENTESMSL
jgi:hypothetical protein